MQRPIRPRWLIRQARELAGAGRGQPRNADLRRAASAAYFAVFHCIAYEAARSVLGDATIDEVLGATRLVAHRSVQEVCRYVQGSSPPIHVSPIVDRLRRSREVSLVAADFAELQEAREEADYDHLAEFDRARTRSLIDRAENVVAILQSDSRPPEFLSFLGLIVLRVR